jgi:hypothetical protein
MEAIHLPDFGWDTMHVLIHSLSFKEILSLPISVCSADSIQSYFTIMMGHAKEAV